MSQPGWISEERASKICVPTTYLSKLNKLKLKGISKVSKNVISSRTMEKTISVLKTSRKREKKNKVMCSKESSSMTTVKMRCHNKNQVLSEIGKSILLHDWSTVAELLNMICSPRTSSKPYSSAMIRICLILLFCHPNSCIEKLSSFIRDMTGYYLDEDVNKLVAILFTLRKSYLPTLVSGKYNRKCDSYKITLDPVFCDL